MNENKVQDLREAIERAYTHIGARYGVELTLGHITYTSTGFRAKTAALDEGADTKEMADYKYRQQALGLPPLDTVFKYNGTMFQIKGFRSRAPKRPIECQSISGDSFRFPLSIIQAIAVTKAMVEATP